MDENIKFAFAMSNDNTFESCHFGEAEKYVIYEWNGTTTAWIKEVMNLTDTADNKPEHDSKEKAMAIIELLKEEEVNVLISKQFGPNIKRINQHFIPVIIDKETPQEALETLNKHMQWIADEWQHSRNNFKLFTIKTGILKTAIAKEK